MNRPNIFRAAAVDRLSTPERLDTLMRVVGPKAWLPLIILAALTASGVFWSFSSRIPVTASGRGVLVRRHAPHALVARASGVLSSIQVRPGDRVTRGAALGTIDLPELEQKLASERGKLHLFDAQRAATTTLEERSYALEVAFVGSRESSLEARIAEEKQALERERRERSDAVATERRALEEQQKTARRLVELARSAPSAEREVLDAQSRLLSVEGLLSANRIRAAEDERAFSERRARIQDLTGELAQLELKANLLTRQKLERTAALAQERDELELSIGTLEAALEQNGHLASDCDGRVVEVGARVGQPVSQGTQLLLIEEGDPTEDLFCVAYFPVRDAQRLSKGALAEIELDPAPQDPSSGLRGKVVDTAPLPASAASIVALTGDGALARSLSSGDARIAVTIELELDPSSPSRYARSSRGLDVVPVAGTTCRVEIRLETLPPIAFVLPSLRSLLGL